MWSNFEEFKKESEEEYPSGIEPEKWYLAISLAAIGGVLTLIGALLPAIKLQDLTNTSYHAFTYFDAGKFAVSIGSMFISFGAISVILFFRRYAKQHLFDTIVWIGCGVFVLTISIIVIGNPESVFKDIRVPFIAVTIGEGPYLTLAGGFFIVASAIAMLWAYYTGKAPEVQESGAKEREFQPESAAVDTTYIAVCPSCGRVVQEEFNLCPSCGTNLKTSCPGCGKETKNQWSLCPYCGASLSTQTQALEGTASENVSFINSFEQAQTQYEEKDYEGALTNILQAKRIRPLDDDVLELEKNVREKIDAGKYNELVSQGYEHEKKGDISEALNCYRKAGQIKEKESLSLRISSIEARLRKDEQEFIVLDARKYENQGKLRNALKLYRRANDIYEDELLQEKILYLRYQIHNRWRRYGKYGLICGGVALAIAAASVIIIEVFTSRNPEVKPEERVTVDGNGESNSIDAQEGNATSTSTTSRGTIFYTTKSGISAYELDAKTHRQIHTDVGIEYATASPDGTKIAFYKTDDGIPWVINSNGTGLRRLIDSGSIPSGDLGEKRTWSLNWSADCKRIFFLVNAGGQVHGQLWTANADGTNPMAVEPHMASSAVSTWGNSFAYLLRVDADFAWHYELKFKGREGKGVESTIQKYTDYESPSVRFFLSHDGSRLVKGEYAKYMIIDTTTGKNLFSDGIYDAYAVAWSPDDKSIAVGMWGDGESEFDGIYIYDSQTQLDIEFIHITGGVESLSWTRQSSL